MTTELSVNDKKSIKVLNNYADDGDIKNYIDSLNNFISHHNLDLPTVTDSDSSIVDKHAVLDLYKYNPSPKINKFYDKLGTHPDIEYWYDTDNQFFPLNNKIMKQLVKDTVNYITSHYNSDDNDRNPNIHDSIGGLKEEI